MLQTTTPTNTPSQNEQAINELLDSLPEVDFSHKYEDAGDNTSEEALKYTNTPYLNALHAKPLTRQKRREKAHFLIPSAVLLMIANSLKPTQANLAFLFELLSSVNYTQSTTAAAFEGVSIPSKKVKIFAGGRDYNSRGDFYDNRLESFDLYQIIDKEKVINEYEGLYKLETHLKPQPELIQALTTHHALKDFDFTKASPAELELYRFAKIVEFRNADFIAFEKARKAYKGINKEFALRLFCVMLAFVNQQKSKFRVYDLRAFMLSKSYQLKKLLTPNLILLLSRFFANLDINIKGHIVNFYFTQYTPPSLTEIQSEVEFIKAHESERNSAQKQAKETRLKERLLNKKFKETRGIDSEIQPSEAKSPIIATERTLQASDRPKDSEIHKAKPSDSPKDRGGVTLKNDLSPIISEPPKPKPSEPPKIQASEKAQPSETLPFSDFAQPKAPPKPKETQHKRTMSYKEIQKAIKGASNGGF